MNAARQLYTADYCRARQRAEERAARVAEVDEDYAAAERHWIAAMEWRIAAHRDEGG